MQRMRLSIFGYSRDDLRRSQAPDPRLSLGNCDLRQRREARLLTPFYERGRGGLSKNDREAARLLKLAADQGIAAAQLKLGVFYFLGRGGLPQDDREAAPRASPPARVSTAAVRERTVRDTLRALSGA
jgi:hypothetical protein